MKKSDKVKEFICDGDEFKFFPLEKKIMDSYGFAIEYDSIDRFIMDSYIKGSTGELDGWYY